MKKIIIYLLFSCALFGESVLEWQNDRADNILTFNDAVNYCQNLNLDGKSDWRLPDIVELTKFSKNVSYIKSNKPKYFWSSTVNKTFKITAWFVSLSDDYQHFSVKTKKLYVKCVRGRGNKMHYTVCKNSNIENQNKKSREL
jgi:hypothetical protein